MGKPSEKVPTTPAIRALRSGGVEFTVRQYRYVEHGGTRQAAAELGFPEHSVVKTLIMEARAPDGRLRPLIILMHGDREVSTKQLAREIGVKSVEPAKPAQVTRLTGYLPGGVSPLGTRTPLPLYVESSILQLERILINGGKRGLQVEIAPADLRRLLSPIEVEVGIAG